MDEQKKRTIARLLEPVLKELGVDPEDPEYEKTPERMASWLLELTQRLRQVRFDLSVTFPAPSSVPVTIQGIRFRSLCQHHFLPFEGVATVSYTPDKTIIGLSKVARIIDYLAAKPQLQEHLTAEIASYLWAHLHPRKLNVRLEARHACMACRGVRQEESSVVTEASLP